MLRSGMKDVIIIIINVRVQEVRQKKRGLFTLLFSPIL